MSNLYEIIAGIGHEAHADIKFGTGNVSGTPGAYTLFNVTGTVSVKILATCETDLAGASATLAVGTALTTAGLIAQATGTDIDANDIWHDNTPDASVELTSVLTEKIVSDNIILTIGTAPVTGGRIKFTVIWKPISSDGHLESAFADVSTSASRSPSASVSPSASASSSSSPSLSPSASGSPSASVSPSASSSASGSPSASVSPSASRSPSASASPSASLSKSIDFI